MKKAVMQQSTFGKSKAKIERQANTSTVKERWKTKAGKAVNGRERRIKEITDSKDTWKT